MTLFIDCDDTLVLYDQEGPNPYGIYHGAPFELNHALIAAVKAFRNEYQDELIVIWSGGGKEYAELWAERTGLTYLSVCIIKDKTTFELIEPEDIVVDDDDLGGRRTYTADEFVMSREGG